MAYDRYEGRRGWREPRGRFSDDGDRFEERSFGRGLDRDDRDERGFFERAGDEVASWFGDDDAERRRRGEAAMAVAAERYSWPALAGEVADVYRRARAG